MTLSAARDRARRGRVVGEQHGELVAAEPGDGVAARGGRSQPPAELHEQAVAVVVAERVVDLLELVEVHDEQGHALVAAAGLGERLLQPVVEQRPGWAGR